MQRTPRRILDEYLVANAAAGGPGAFNPLFARWHRSFLRHAFRLLGDADLTKDAVQDAWLEIARGLPRLKDHTAFQAWAFRIVSRRCAKTINGLQRNRQIKKAATEDPGPGMRAASPTETNLDMRSVKAAIATLSSEQRAAIDLFYLEEFSVAEIAVALDVPAGTVKTRLMHARKKLRAILEGDRNDQGF